MLSISAGRSDTMRGAAHFFDGETAGRHVVRVGLTSDRQAIMIEGDGLPEPLRWPLADLRAISDPTVKESLVLTRFQDTDDETPRDPARLVLEDRALVDWIRTTRPNLYRRDLRRGTGMRIVRNLAMATAAVGLMLFVILPAMANTLARIIPLESEVNFGKSVVGQMERFLGGSTFGDLHCSAPEGREALDRMTARLMDGKDIDYDLNVVVFDHGMLNAFAAPGGQVVLLRGLLEAADGPDAVAAVLAHEIGHVVNRDPTRNALRAAGSAGLLSMLLGDITGGTMLVIVADHMLNTSYSREAELAADAYAVAVLDEAGISTAGFGAFFDRLAQEEGGFDLPEYLSTHPATAERAARARAHADGQGATTPSLSEADWQALKLICD